MARFLRSQSWRDMDFPDRNYVHDSARMGNLVCLGLILGFLALATASAAEIQYPVRVANQR